MLNEGFSSDSNGKESAYNVGDLCLIPGSGRSPGKGNGNPLQYSGELARTPWRFHGQRSLLGYSPWTHKELDTTERLTHIYMLNGGMSELLGFNNSVNCVLFLSWLGFQRHCSQDVTTITPWNSIECLACPWKLKHSIVLLSLTNGLLPNYVCYFNLLSIYVLLEAIG